MKIKSIINMFNKKRSYFSVIVSVILVLSMLFATSCGKADAPEVTTGAETESTSSSAGEIQQTPSDETVSLPEGQTEAATEDVLTEAALVLPEDIEGFTSKRYKYGKIALTVYRKGSL